VTALRALAFDVLGTVVDCRSGVLAEAPDVETRTGVRATQPHAPAQGGDAAGARPASSQRSCEAQGMDFRVHRPDGHENFTGTSRYTFSEKGFLVVHTNDGRRLTYSPSGWTRIEEASPEGGEWVMTTE
jgi:hypothetical protein